MPRCFLLVYNNNTYISDGQQAFVEQEEYTQK